MVAVVMGVEDVLDGLVGDALGGFHGEAGAAGEVRVDHDQVVLHLDDGVVAVAEGFQVALAEPDAGDN